MSKPIGHTEYCRNPRCRGNCQKPILPKSLIAAERELRALHEKYRALKTQKARRLCNDKIALAHKKLDSEMTKFAGDNLALRLEATKILLP